MKEKTRFVERQDSSLVVFDSDLRRSRICYGAKLFANGHRAYVHSEGVDVFDKNSTLIDKSLDDVFYFLSGDSFKKKKGSSVWEFFRCDKMLVASGLKVKVLSPFIAGIKTQDDVWHIYHLHIHLNPKLLIEIEDKDVIDVDCHEFAGSHPVLSMKLDQGVRLLPLNKGKISNLFKVEANDYTVTFGGLFVVSDKKSVLSLKHNSSCILICAVKGVELSLYDSNMRKLHEKVSDVISFKNGVYFLNFDDEWKFYSRNGNYFGSLVDVEIDRNGIILGRQSEGQKKMLPVGRFDDSHVMIVQDEKIVITDGDRIVSIVNERFDNITILG